MTNKVYIGLLCFAGFMALQSCRPLMLTGTEANLIDTANHPSVDSTVLNIIDPYRDQLETKMDVPLAVLEEDLVKTQPEGSLGNHLAYIIHWSAVKSLSIPIDFSVMNYGGQRVPYVNKGVLKVRDAYQIMPFDNSIVVMEIPGSVIQSMVDRMAAAGGWPVEKMTYIIDNGSASDITINGESLNLSRTYTMAISDYLANGGDHLDMLKAYSYIETDILLRDAIIEYWKWMAEEGKEIKGLIDGRVSIK